jgi:four helix bundle protein
MAYGGFKDLECYKESRELRIFISAVVKKFPEEEKYLLIRQIIDSSRSITRNIAEGYGRFTYKETRNFFIIARGSVTETMEHLLTAFDENYIDQALFDEGQTKCERVFRLINGYIGYLERSIKTEA